MKKTIILLALMIVSMGVSAQWEQRGEKDEFGDATGNTRTIMELDGTFSNSATRNSKATVFIEKRDYSVGFVLYDYGRVANEYYDHKFKVIVKDANGKKTMSKASINTILYSYGKAKTKKWVWFDRPTRKSDKQKARMARRVAKYPESAYIWDESLMWNALTELKRGDAIYIEVDSSTYLFQVK